jgi:L-fuculose-phosphate aldolase
VNARKKISPLFRSREAARLKKEICDIGSRLWQRNYVDGNGGNITARLTDAAVLCTPSQVSKGFMQPDDICLVDMNGNQLAGTRRRTSEILMHLEIYKLVPHARAVVHAHPPHATAFAVAGKTPPVGLSPEFEVFISRVALCPYATPSSADFAATVRPFAQQFNTLLLRNHGVVTRGNSVEDACFKIEILDMYCQTILAARALRKKLKPLSRKQIEELHVLRARLTGRREL